MTPSWVLVRGDCVEALREFAPSSVDAVVTDPPYGLEFMGKDWDKLDAGLPQEAVWKGRRGAGGSGFTDGPTVTFKGSVRGVDYGGRRSRFCRCTLCGKRQFSGNPCKCPDPDWTLESPDGAPSSMLRMQRWHEAWAREVLRVMKPGAHLLAFGGTRTYHRLVCALEDAGLDVRDTIAWIHGEGFPKSHNLDGEHEGWGTCLKPAFEPIVVARKPLDGTVADNVERHGVGALHVDACRIPGEVPATVQGVSSRQGEVYGHFRDEPTPSIPHPLGRWPANVVLDPAAAAVLDATDLEASRFFYTAKASTEERNTGLPAGARNDHPTVKPVDLMRWLVRMVTPAGGVVLDPFAGSGTTGVAALEEACRFVGIERDAGYAELARARIGAVSPLLPFGAV